MVLLYLLTGVLVATVPAIGNKQPHNWLSSTYGVCLNLDVTPLIFQSRTIGKENLQFTGIKLR